MVSMSDVYILSAARTPIGKFGGGLSTTPATELGAIAIRAAVERPAWRPERIDEAIMGQVLQAGAGQAPARQAALKAGLPEGVSATTINKVCGSGLKAVMMGASAIRAGDAERHRGRRHGEHEHGAVPPAPGAHRLPARQRHGRRLDRPRRAVVLDLRRPHGHARRAGGGQARRDARGPGRVRAALAPATPSRPRRPGASTTRSCRSPCPARRGDTVVTADEGPRADTTPRGAGQAEAGIPAGRRHRHRRQRAGHHRRRGGARHRRRGCAGRRAADWPASSATPRPTSHRNGCSRRPIQRRAPADRAGRRQRRTTSTSSRSTRRSRPRCWPMATSSASTGTA